MSDSNVINLDERRRQSHHAPGHSSQSALMTDGVVDLLDGVADGRSGKPSNPPDGREARVYVLNDLIRNDPDSGPRPHPPRGGPGGRR